LFPIKPVAPLPAPTALDAEAEELSLVVAAMSTVSVLPVPCVSSLSSNDNPGAPLPAAPPTPPPPFGLPSWMPVQLKPEFRKQYTDAELMEMKRYGMPRLLQAVPHCPPPRRSSARTILNLHVACCLPVPRSCFDQIDLDKGGTLDVSELQQAFVSMGEAISVAELETVIAEVDEDGSGDVRRQRQRHRPLPYPPRAR
jgi:hypothetical protein